MVEATGAFWIVIAILFGLALLACACGFKKFVYFMSVGYGLAIVAIGLGLIVFTAGKFGFTGIIASSWVNYILAIVLILYGARLSGFLLFREIKSASYKKTLEKVAGSTEKKMPVFVKATIWLFCAIMYIMQTYSVIFRVGSSASATGVGLIAPLVGAVVALIGLVIETLADLEKNAAKKVNPHSCAMSGLYKLVRCPNYFGEIIFWTGIFVSGVDIFLADWAAWVISILGYLLIVYVMISGAKRLEKRQNKSYANDPAFQEYVKKTPILIPFFGRKSKLDAQPEATAKEEK